MPQRFLAGLQYVIICLKVIRPVKNIQLPDQIDNNVFVNDLKTKKLQALLVTQSDVNNASPRHAFILSRNNILFNLNLGKPKLLSRAYQSIFKLSIHLYCR